MPYDQEVFKKAVIMIASDHEEDAEIVRWHLAKDYKNLTISAHPDAPVNDFEQHKEDFNSHQPDVLILAFNPVSKSETFHQELLNQNNLTRVHPHRTVILCNKEEINHAFDLCKKNVFDDYVMFWPIQHDVTRLSMAVHHAIQNLTAFRQCLSFAELAKHSRAIIDLEKILKKNFKQGDTCISQALETLETVEHAIQAALDNVSTHSAQDGDATEAPAQQTETKPAPKEPAKKLSAEDKIRAQLNKVTESLQPVSEWSSSFQHDCAPHMKSAKKISHLSEKVTSIIQVVDDDNMARKLLHTILTQEHYEVMLATGGIAALNQIYKRRPDLILMDMMMPEINGVEMTRRLKSSDSLSGIPIIMVTGTNDKKTVIQCLEAGACDFVVKPFNRDSLLDKIKKYLQQAT